MCVLLFLHTPGPVFRLQGQCERGHEGLRFLVLLVHPGVEKSPTAVCLFTRDVLRARPVSDNNRRSFPTESEITTRSQRHGAQEAARFIGRTI